MVDPLVNGGGPKAPEFAYLNPCDLAAKHHALQGARMNAEQGCDGVTIHKGFHPIPANDGEQAFGNRRSIEITDAWRSYVEHARISLAHGERAMRSAKETKDSAGDSLEIGKSPDVDPVLVEILYSVTLPLYPALEISVHSEPSSDLAHRLMSADLDIALITQPERNAKLTMTKLAETPLHIVLVA